MTATPNLSRSEGILGHPPEILRYTGLHGRAGGAEGGPPAAQTVREDGGSPERQDPRGQNTSGTETRRYILRDRSHQHFLSAMLEVTQRPEMVFENGYVTIEMLKR